MPVKILIMGLPGAGKTYFAERLKTYLENNSSYKNMPGNTMSLFENLPTYWKGHVDWFNADEIRKKYNDWDFSREGRIRQSLRMAKFALECVGDYVICDFVAPLTEMRQNFKADWTIWMDTIEEGRFEDTNRAFVRPEEHEYDFRINVQDADNLVPIVGKRILENNRYPVFNWNKPTAQMLGRYQPWHGGHQALFKRALEKVGQVCIMVRQCPTDEKNPFDFSYVQNRIRRSLDLEYKGRYTVIAVPDIVRISYGRDVGYVIEKEEFTEDVHSISATEIRKQMGL